MRLAISPCNVHAAIVDENCFPGNGDCQNSPRMYFSCRERNRKFPIDVMSLGYNRLMNHVRYMVARAIHGEKLKMNLMNICP